MFWTEHLKAVGPFLAAIVLVVVSPLLDEVVWKSTYHRFYREDLGRSEADSENLRTSAEWVVDMTQLYTGVALSWTGLILALPKVGVAITFVSMAVVMAPLAWAAHYARSRQLHVDRTIWRLPYTAAQATIVLANALCAWLVWAQVGTSG